MPVLIGTVGAIILRMRPLFRTMQVRIDRVNRVLREQITGIRVIRAFVRDEHEQDRFAEANDELTDVSLRRGRLMALMFPTVMLVVNVSSVAVLWFGAHRIDSGGMQIGALTAFLSYLMQILMSVMMATFMFMMVPARRGLRRAHPGGAGHRVQRRRRRPSPVTALRRHGQLELRDVEFRYPGAEAPVLRGVDLVARPGETTAIIGSTGSGKSTLLSLVPRLFDATGGEVLVDGVDVRELDPALLAATVGLVPQKPYLFSGTVATNLRYGRPDATDEELWQALEVAQAERLRRAHAERAGRADRAGRHQRLRRPAPAAGDRPGAGRAGRRSTSSTTRSRPSTTPPTRRCAAALARETADATVVIVAQRVSTIRDADRIIVLDEGRVVGTGTHNDMADNRPTGRSCSPSSPSRRRRHDRDRDWRRRPRVAASPAARAGPARMMGAGSRPRGRMDFKGSSQAAAAACCAPTGTLVGVVARLGVASVGCRSLGPQHPRPRHRPDLRRGGRPAVAGRHHQGRRRSAGLRAQRRGHVADMLSGIDFTPGQGIDFGASAGCCSGSLVVYVGAVAVRPAAGPADHPSCSAPSTGCARRSRRSSPGCR